MAAPVLDCCRGMAKDTAFVLVATSHADNRRAFGADIVFVLVKPRITRSRCVASVHHVVVAVFRPGRQGKPYATHMYQTHDVFNYENGRSLSSVVPRSRPALA